MHTRACVARTRGHHTGLAIAHHATTTGRRVGAGARRVVHGAVEVAIRDAGSGGLLHTDLVALGNLAFELLAANLTTLGKGDVERL